MIALLWVLCARADEAEDEVLALLDTQEYITARREAEALLAQEPESIVGHYVLGTALWKGEVDLGRARAELIRAKDLYERDYPQNSTSDPWKLHSDTLEALIWVSAEMDEREEQLAWIDLYNDRFEPDLTVERAWALMKLGRYNEARAVAVEGTLSEENWKQSSGLNTLCALEGELGEREANYEACIAALEQERAGASPDPTVDAYNATLGAIRTLRWEEAETLAKESASGQGRDAANPYTLLLDLYLRSGRGEEAVQALVEMQRFKLRMPPTMRDQGRAEGDSDLGMVLLVAGQGDKALELFTRALEQPDRMGMESSDAEQASGGYALMRLVARRVYEERLREQASSGPWWERAWTALRLAWPDPDDWEDRNRVRGALSDERRLERTLSMFLNGSIFLPSWLAPELPEVIGGGVCRVVLNRERSNEALADLSPWFDAIEAEIAWRDGDWDEAGRLARAALEDLPRAENLMRARVAAIAADATWRRGRPAEALPLYSEAMQLEAGVIRRLGLALPARVEGSGPLGEDVAERLSRSPRILLANNAFRVEVSAGAAPSVCLYEPDGALLSCTAPVPAPRAPEGEDLPPDAHARAVVEAWHERAFAMPLGLSKIDLNSLDGATAVASEARRKQVEELLGGLAEPDKK